VVARLRLVFTQLAEYVAKNGSEKTQKSSWIMTSIMEEVLDTLADKDSDDTQTAIYFAYFGRLLEWVGSGNTDVLPDEMKKWLNETGNIPEALLNLSHELADETAGQEPLFTESEIPALTA
jgi:hypothetical protein